MVNGAYLFFNDAFYFLMMRFILIMHFILWNVLFDDAFYLNLFKTLFIQSFIYIQSFIFTPIPIISK